MATHASTHIDDNAPSSRRPEPQSAPPGPHTGAVSLSEPMHWLSLGWQDFRHAPAVGLSYGLIVALLGWLILALGDHPYFIAAAISGFLLLGPILGAGLIEASRTIEAGQAPTFDSSLRGFDRNRRAIWGFSLTLSVIAIVWLALSTSLLIALMGPLAPRVEQALWDSALQLISYEQMFAWAAIGGLLAALCFCISIVSVPLILDQHVTARVAIRRSWQTVARHPWVSAVWALLIAVLTAIGFATAMIGLVVIYPLLGHASWHAYRALQR